MSDYKCDICEKKATVHITKFVDGHKLKFHLCEACAKNNQDKLKALIDTQIALKSKGDFNVEDILGEIVADKKKAPSGLICNHCGSSFETFEKVARVPCEHCYEAFSGKFDEILGQMHLSNKHKGKALNVKKAPKSKKTPLALEDLPFKEAMELVPEISPKQDSLEELSQELAIAISQERYEDAAVLRDKLKSLDDKD